MLDLTRDYDGLQPFTDEYAKKKAELHGLNIEYSDDHTLQLDIDSDESFRQFEEQMKLLYDLGIVTIKPVPNGYFYDYWTLRRSKSGNSHVTIKLTAPLSITERILLQACLGSDIKRELLSYAGFLKGQKNPVLLFRPKEGT